MPPPRRMVAMLASTRSVVGNAELLRSGIVSPFFSCPCGSGGGASSTCCEPRRLVCPIAASALDGSFTSGCRSSVSVATQFFSSIARTRPTKTSATRTRLLTLSANVSGICT